MSFATSVFLALLNWVSIAHLTFFISSNECDWICADSFLFLSLVFSFCLAKIASWWWQRSFHQNQWDFHLIFSLFERNAHTSEANGSSTWTLTLRNNRFSAHKLFVAVFCLHFSFVSSSSPRPAEILLIALWFSFSALNRIIRSLSSWVVLEIGCWNWSTKTGAVTSRNAFSLCIWPRLIHFRLLLPNVVNFPACQFQLIRVGRSHRQTIDRPKFSALSSTLFRVARRCDSFSFSLISGENEITFGIRFGFLHREKCFALSTPQKSVRVFGLPTKPRNE